MASRDARQARGHESILYGGQLTFLPGRLFLPLRTFLPLGWGSQKRRRLLVHQVAIGFRRLPHASLSRDRLCGGLLSHKSSIAITPDAGSEAWRRIQEIRRACRAAGLYRWPPHINLSYPSLPPQNILSATDTSVGDAAAAISHHEPFDVRLSRLSIFSHSKSVTLILEPETKARASRTGPWIPFKSPDNFCSLLALSIEATLPLEARQRERPFVPHMSVARFEDSFIAEPWQKKLGLELKRAPIEFRVENVRVLVRREEEPFGFIYDVPLLGTRDTSTHGNSIFVTSAQPPYEHPPLSIAFPNEGYGRPARSTRQRKGRMPIFGRRLCEPLARRRRPWYT